MKIKLLIMKNLINILVLFAATLFFYGCEKENKTIPEKEDEKELNEETFACKCTYKNICLDTIRWGNFKTENILGEWKLEAFVDTILCTVTLMGEKENMNINFQENNLVSGHTISNNFNGNYSFYEGKIVFSDIITTEIVEPEIGKIFIQSLSQRNDVFITKEKLFLSSHPIIIFSKL